MTIKQHIEQLGTLTPVQALHVAETFRAAAHTRIAGGKEMMNPELIKALRELDTQINAARKQLGRT